MTDFSLPTARDFMSTGGCTLTADMDLLDAVDRLIAHNCSAAPVVGGGGELLGMLTEKDCLRILARLTYDSPASPGVVSEFQSPVACICEPDMDLFRVAKLFLDNNFPVLPVEEGGKLIGTISRQGMLRGIQALRDQVAIMQKRFEQEAGRQADRPRGIENMQRKAASWSPEQLVRVFGR